MSCLTEPAAGLGLSWDPSPDPSVVSYTVLYGTNSGSYMTRIEVGNQTNATIEIPKIRATYYFVVIATTIDGRESLPSNEVSYVPPGELLIFKTADSQNWQIRFSVRMDEQWQIQVSEDLIAWTILSEGTALAHGWIDVFDPVVPYRPARFYRWQSP